MKKPPADERWGGGPITILGCPRNVLGTVPGERGGTRASAACQLALGA
jgi:hypothetical protein